MWFLAALGVLLAAVVAAGVGFIATPNQATVHRQTSDRTVSRPVVLHPPGPIPGYLLIADRGNNRMLLVDSARHIYWRYPGGGKLGMPFRFDDDTFFGPHHDRIISNQEDQNTIQIISFPGKRILWRYGHVDVKSGRSGYLNTPDDAYLLPDNRVTVADAYNCRVLFMTLAHRIVRQYGTTGVCRHDPPRYLGAVNGATPLPDGGTLVSEIAGSWIDDFGPTGKLRWAVQAPVGYPSDPQLLGANRVLLADYSAPGHAIIMTRTGRVLWRYGPSSGPGELNHPSLAEQIAPGLIAINDDFRHRAVIVSIRLHRIIWQYGHTDQPGTAPGYLNTPDGLDLLKTKDAQSSPIRKRLLQAPVRKAAPLARGGLTVDVPFQIPAPVSREVAVTHNGSVLIAGGLAASGASTTGVFQLNPSTGKLTRLGAVPQAFHDAVGAVFGNALYVFGGGAAQSSSTVQRFDLGTRRGAVASQLPRALSDIAAARTANGVFLVGGYDAHVPRPEIYRTTDGTHFVARRPPAGWPPLPGRRRCWHEDRHRRRNIVERSERRGLHPRHGHRTGPETRAAPRTDSARTGRHARERGLHRRRRRRCGDDRRRNHQDRPRQRSSRRRLGHVAGQRRRDSRDRLQRLHHWWIGSGRADRCSAPTGGTWMKTAP